MFSSSLVSESFSSLPPDDRFFRNNFVTKSKCQNVLICWKPGRQRCGPIFDYQYISMQSVFPRWMHFKKLKWIMFPKSSKTSNLLTWYQRSLHGRLRKSQIFGEIFYDFCRNFGKLQTIAGSHYLLHQFLEIREKMVQKFINFWWTNSSIHQNLVMNCYSSAT